MPEIFIGSDHRGFDLKTKLIADLTTGKIRLPEDTQIADLGPFELNPADDFNDAAAAVASAVQQNPGSFGILICGSAHGIVIQANRFKGIRAIAAYSDSLAKIGREHNDANVICLSADFTNPASIDQIVEVFVNTNFLAEERFIRRNARLDEIGG